MLEITKELITSIDEELGKEKTIFLGTIMQLTPSGKVCTPWSNITEEEIEKDEEWWEELEYALEKINTYAHISEGDGCDILVSRCK